MFIFTIAKIQRRFNYTSYYPVHAFCRTYNTGLTCFRQWPKLNGGGGNLGTGTDSNNSQQVAHNFNETQKN